MKFAIVGMGPVGRNIAERSRKSGFSVVTYDIEIEKTGGFDRADSVAAAIAAAHHVVAAVPASAAPRVAEAAVPAVTEATTYSDWSSSSPEGKRRLAGLFPDGRFVDVALLDSITAEAPLVCVAGADLASAVEQFTSLGFDVMVSGERAGDAAVVKMVRSLFMKPLEVLSVELLRTMQAYDPSGSALASIERTLGGPFSEMARALLETNRQHAERRALELAEVIETVAPTTARPILEAALERLLELRDTWAAPGAPPSGSDASSLLQFLATRNDDHGHG